MISLSQVFFQLTLLFIKVWHTQRSEVKLEGAGVIGVGLRVHSDSPEVKGHTLAPGIELVLMQGV